MIGITVTKAHGEYDPGTSKFFGSPTMPEEWLSDGTVGDDDFFFCQLKLSEFAKYDKENNVPHKGFIYIFLTENDGKYIPNICYCEDEPDTLIDDFNAGFDFLGDVETEYSIDFFETDDNTDGTRILIEKNDEVILLQYDPLDDNMPEFLRETEGIAQITLPDKALKNMNLECAKFEII